MKKFTLFCLVSCSFYYGYAQVNLSVVTPGSYEMDDTSVSVGVTVYSSAALTAVTAAINNRQVNLTYISPVNNAINYQGVLSLKGLPYDTLNLIISATDANNYTVSDTVEIIHDSPPVITVDSPFAYTVARPYAYVKATATDSSGIQSFTLSLLNQPDSASYPGGSVDTALDLSAYTSASIVLTAVDNRGQVSRRTIPVFVDMSPYLSVYYTAKGEILDFRYNRALFLDGNNNNNLRIADIADSAVTSIPVPYMIGRNYTQTQPAYLTPYGAIFMTNPGPLPPTGSVDSIFEWNQGAITLRQSCYGLSADSDFAAWTSAGVNDSLYLRDLSTQQNTGIARTDQQGTVSGNGLTLYASGGLYQYLGGTSTLISSVGAAPVTDGQNVVFTGVFPKGVATFSDSIMWYDGTSTHVLGPDTLSWSYAVNHGYISYLSPDTLSQPQILVRSPSGHTRQVTSVGSTANNPPAISCMNMYGQMMYAFYDSYYGSQGIFYADTTGAPKRIDTQNPGVRFYNGQWFYILGNTVFKVNVDTSFGFGITPFSKSVAMDSSLAFSAADFIQHFTGPPPGPGGLVSVMIATLPAHGQLTVAGTAVSAGQSLSPTDLGHLVYLPVAGYIGPDTVGWKAFNGVQYTPGDTPVVITVEKDVVTAVTGVGTPAAGISASPNPFTKQTVVSGFDASKTYALYIYSMGGALLGTQNVYHANAVTVSAATFPQSGIYLIHIINITDNRTEGTLKVVKL